MSDNGPASTAYGAAGRDIGVLPTIGGAVSLLPRGEVDALHDAHERRGAAFVPVVPDSGNRPAAGLPEWHVAAIEQALVFGRPPFAADQVTAMDGALQTYRGAGVDWRRVHACAAGADASVPVYRDSPYWMADGEPLSVLAFSGAHARSIAAAAPATAGALLGFMGDDPDPAVRQAVQARRGAPATPGTLVASTQVMTPSRAASAPETRHGRTVLTAVITGILTALLVTAVFAALIAIGLGNGYSVTIVDREARAATTRTQLTGTFDLDEQKTRICKGKADYLSCLNMHVAMYDSICMDQSLTGAAHTTCGDLSRFIKGAKAEYKRCGAGCKTKADGKGLWGWPYLKLAPVSEQVSNGDALPELTHEEKCVFALGPITLGTCPGRPS